MIFPELRAAVKGFMQGFGSEPVSLDLKGNVGPTFNAVTAEWYARNGYPGIYSMLSGGMPAWSGEPVSVGTALNHSVVWACNRIISESVGFLPLNLMQRNSGMTTVADWHPMYSALHDEPNAEMTAMGFPRDANEHCLLRGNAYAKIIRRSGVGTAIELEPLQPDNVRPDRERTGEKRLVYVVKDGNDPEKVYTVQRGKPQDILHIKGIGEDGIQGYSVVTAARQSVGTALSAERNVARFYAMGGRVPYVLETVNKFRTEHDFDKFRADWERTYAEPHRAPILENGLTYKQIGLSAADAQLLETRQFTVAEICRWFSISPHLVGDLSRATFSNIEQLALDFIKFTLTAWLTRWEQELRRCVLTPQEKAQGYYFKHNVNALLRGDFQSRMAGYATMLQNGIASVNEVRELEDWNPTDGGDDHHIQLNMQSLPGGVPLTSQAAQLIKLGSTAGSVEGA
jgi:HK97 family phage portal protein